MIRTVTKIIFLTSFLLLVVNIQSIPVPLVFVDQPFYVHSSNLVRRGIIPFAGSLGLLGGTGYGKLKNYPVGTSATSSNGAINQSAGQATELSDSSNVAAGGTYQGSSGGTYGKYGSRLSPLFLKNKVLGMGMPIL
ncbi:2739_t:CDS:1 [Acaulospora morrowiae]|uniref:2739_t:CDS:1 n=1 Tax=Acaulospora morrowiae TaxID=94023 RepID=A0A9N8V899_9GLOM|nr:2739_t:CDS:1 [Acaulospora morrowiae]